MLGEKNPHISGPAEFKLRLFKGQLHLGGGLQCRKRKPSTVPTAGCVHFLGLQSAWPKTTETYSLRVLEVRGPKSRGRMGGLVSGSLWGSEGPPAPRLSPGFWCHRRSWACGHIAPISASAFLWPSTLRTSDQISSLMRTPFLRVRAHADPGWSHLQILNLVTSARHCFHMKSHAQVPGLRMWTCLFKGGGRGHHSTHLDWPEIKDTRKVNTVKANPFH